MNNTNDLKFQYNLYTGFSLSVGWVKKILSSLLDFWKSETLPSVKSTQIIGFFAVVVVFWVFFAHTCGMRKFPGQGWNPHHSSDQSHSSDNARFVTPQVTRELQVLGFDISDCSPTCPPPGNSGS